MRGTGIGTGRLPASHVPSMTSTASRAATERALQTTPILIGENTQDSRAKRASTPEPIRNYQVSCVRAIAKPLVRRGNGTVRLNITRPCTVATLIRLEKLLSFAEAVDFDASLSSSLLAEHQPGKRIAK
jgi:hypothetical protein